MKILYLTQYLARNTEPGANRQWELLQEFARRGHTVDVIVSGQHYLGLHEQSSGQAVVGTTWEGGRLFQVAGVGRYRASLWRRIANYVVFGARASRLVLRLGRYDVVLASTPSPFVGLAGWLAACRGRARLWIEVRDLWPEAVFESGMLRQRWVLAWCRRLNAFLYARAQRVVALTPGIRKHLIESYGIPADRVELIPNGWSRQVFEHPGPEPDFAALGVHVDRFNVMYTGAFGIGNNDIPTILAAASLLRHEPGIQFVFVGDGERRGDIERAQRDGAHVVLVPAQPKNVIPHFLLAGSACILTLPGGKYFEIFLQNKFFDYLGSERPVVAAVAGDQAEVLRACGGGIVVEPEDARGLANAVLRLRDAPGEGSEMGRRARRYAEQHFDRDALVRRYADELEEAVT